MYHTSLPLCGAAGEGTGKTRPDAASGLALEPPKATVKHRFLLGPANCDVACRPPSTNAAATALLASRQTCLGKEREVRLMFWNLPSNVYLCLAMSSAAWGCLALSSDA